MLGNLKPIRTAILRRVKRTTGQVANPNIPKEDPP